MKYQSKQRVQVAAEDEKEDVEQQETTSAIKEDAPEDNGKVYIRKKRCKSTFKLSKTSARQSRTIIPSSSTINYGKLPLVNLIDPCIGQKKLQLNIWYKNTTGKFMYYKLSIYFKNVSNYYVLCSKTVQCKRTLLRLLNWNQQKGQRYLKLTHYQKIQALNQELIGKNCSWRFVTLIVWSYIGHWSILQEKH